MRLREDIAGIATPSLLGLALLLQFAHVGHDHDSVESEPPRCRTTVHCVHLDRLEADVDSLQQSGTTFVSRVVVGTGVDMRPARVAAMVLVPARLQPCRERTRSNASRTAGPLAGRAVSLFGGGLRPASNRQRV